MREQETSLDNKPPRETPAPEPLRCGHSDAAHFAPLDEPVLDIDNIQGNIFNGFNKDHRMMVFMQIHDPAAFRPWLASVLPFVATASEVIAFNRLFKSVRTRRGGEGTIKSTWLNIAFTATGLASLDVPVDQFTDKSFTAGLLKQAEKLGDPVGTNTQGDPVNWVIGGSHNPRVDLMLIIEADDRADMITEVERIETSLTEFKDASGKPAHPGVHVIHKDEGANLPAPLSGHEHFGFLDGVSQPGVRGLLSEDKHDVLTLRQNPLKRDQVEKGLIISAQGKPGQDLLWPGEFVFGYPEQNAENPPDDKKDFDGPNPHPGPVAKASADPVLAEWARDGSFLVFRRLHQNVGAFHEFLRTTATQLGIRDTPHSSGPKYVGSKLVGRWPSGAPVERTPGDDLPLLGDTDCANNNFEFQGAGDKIEPAANDPFACVDVTFPLAPDADDKGQRCPFSGHIRKAYPRDDESTDKTDMPDVDGCHSRSVLNEVNTQTHRMLRRGLPYGPVSRSTTDAPFPEDDTTPRGLQFLAYQTSIEDQFEFVTRCWINNPDFKEPGVGHDPIIGQNNAAGENRKRTFTVVDQTGKSCPVSTNKDWVIPTGGGYFFAPSLRALEDLATPGNRVATAPKKHRK